MIIDAREAANPPAGLRDYCAKSAVAIALQPMQPGETIAVKALVDPRGFHLPLARLAMNVNQVKGNRRFTVRAGRDGALATITRLA